MYPSIWIHLDWGKPEYLEETPIQWGEQKNCAQLAKAKIKTPTTGGAGQTLKPPGHYLIHLLITTEMKLIWQSSS